MGMNYDVTFKIKVKDTEGADAAASAFADSNISAYKKRIIGEGTPVETFGDHIKLMLSWWEKWTCYKSEETDKEGFAVYKSSFDASYSWEVLLMDFFRAIAPFLEDRSSLKIYPDSDYDLLVVENGKSVQLH